MSLAPEVASFGDETHETGETNLAVDGGGFGAFPGSVWLYANQDRSGAADELTVSDWNDVRLSGIAIPASPNNESGTVYLFVQREDLAWSQPFAFTLSDGGGTPVQGFTFDINGSAIQLIDSDDEKVFTPLWDDELPSGVTLSSVTHALPEPLINGGESNTDTTSSVRISGARHGQMYLIRCAAQLSNGQTINRAFPLRCFNG